MTMMMTMALEAMEDAQEESVVQKQQTMRIPMQMRPTSMLTMTSWAMTQAGQLRVIWSRQTNEHQRMRYMQCLDPLAKHLETKAGN
jgi:hypothetical protein